MNTGRSTEEKNAKLSRLKQSLFPKKRKNIKSSPEVTEAPEKRLNDQKSPDQSIMSNTLHLSPTDTSSDCKNQETTPDLRHILLELRNGQDKLNQTMNQGLAVKGNVKSLANKVAIFESGLQIQISDIDLRMKQLEISLKTMSKLPTVKNYDTTIIAISMPYDPSLSDSPAA